MNEYDVWNKAKQFINRSVNFPDVREREVRWCSIGQNIGYEINGKGSTFTRPVLIIKKLSRSTLLIAPMTTKIRTGSWYPTIGLHGQNQNVCINQIRTIDTKRIYSCIGRITANNMTSVKNAVQNIFLTSTPSQSPLVLPKER